MKWILTILATIWLAVPVAAQTNCGQRDDVFANLASRYGESPVFAGLGGGDVIVSFWLNPTTGTWTAIGARPDGLTCVIASGQSGGAVDFSIQEGDPA